MLAWRDLKVRYRHTFFGVAWVILQPLLNMLLFTFLFNRIAKFQAGGNIPYGLHALSGLILWGFISAAIQNSAQSLVGNAHLISKIYFPRLLMPLTHVVTGLVDFFVSGLLLVPLMLWYGLSPARYLLAMPLVVALAATQAAAIGIWFAALNAQYRDVRVALPFVMQLWMFATPVVYPLEALPPRVQTLLYGNPVTGLIGVFRFCVFGTPASWVALGWSVALTLALLVSGLAYFRRTEVFLADSL
jgi:lipopolysaccharide transport system permease protein